MLFNSYLFLFCFLPLALLGFYGLEQADRPRASLAWLVLVSLVYYGWWNPPYLLLLGASLLLNHRLGQRLARAPSAPLLALGVTANLAVLGWYKYARFAATNLGALLGTDWSLSAVVLPLAISFFTFQQISYLVDSHRKVVGEVGLLDYLLFVTFFPQLIAGPIVHHKEMLPQFTARARASAAERAAQRPADLAVGSALFSLGLVKKVVLADSLAGFASPVFGAAQAGPVGTQAAWLGVLAYTFQLYFDFSGYSDMALGIGRMFGIRLPLNFDSPYKATSIVDFWRRWHLTLSRFLRDYLYIALGGNRHGRGRRYLNLMATMLLGGLWHGAGWTFVFWGGLHGLYLVINHGWGALVKARGWALQERLWWRLVSTALTFAAAVFAWIFFRAADFPTAARLIGAMAGQGVGGVPFDRGDALLWLAAASVVVWGFPNTQELLRHHRPAFDWRDHEPRAVAGLRWAGTRLAWQPRTGWWLASACGLVAAILLMSRTSEFLYYQF